MAESTTNETNAPAVEAKTPEAAEPVEAKTPALTEYKNFIVPQQDLIEKVIDQRLAAHAAHEEASTKTTTSRTRKS